MAEGGDCMDNNLYEAARNPGINIPLHINDQHFRYRTPGDCNNVLHVAAQHGNQGFIAQALNRLSNDRCQLLCQQNAKGETPLHLAAQFGHTTTVEALLLAHDDVQPGAGLPFVNGRKLCWSVRDMKGDTPLHRALRSGHENIAMLLLDRDIQLVSIDNEAGESPAYLAAENFCNIFLQKVINDDRDGKCSMSFSGSFGQTVFHSARRLTENIMNGLIGIRRGFLLKAQDEKGRTVVHYAVEENKHPIVETLLRVDNSLAYLHDNDGLTPLHIASNKGLFPMVCTILELSPQSVEFRDKYGKTPLHHVVEMKAKFLANCLNNTTMKELINQVDNDGNTPLHVALINSKHFSAFELLMVHGCNWRLKNNEGYSPLDLCKSNHKISYMFPDYFALRYLEDGGQRELMRSKWTQSSCCSALRAICIINLEGMEKEELEQLISKIAIAAVLLLPLNFATAVSVPGGYNSNTGIPILCNLKSFRAFMILEALSFSIVVLTLIHCTFGVNKHANKKTLARASIRGLQCALVTTILAYISGLIATTNEKMGVAYICIASFLALAMVVLTSMMVVGGSKAVLIHRGNFE